MTKTTRNLALIAVFSIIVAGCTTLLATQSNQWATQAEDVARTCPAAAAAAKEARAAANQAASVESRMGDLTRMSDNLKQLSRQIDELWQGLVGKGLAKGSPPGEPYELTAKSPEQASEDARYLGELAAACRRNAERYAAASSSGSEPAGLEICEQGCSNASECSDKADYWSRSAQGYVDYVNSDFAKTVYQIEHLQSQYDQLLLAFSQQRSSFLQEIKDAGYGTAIPLPAAGNADIPSEIVTAAQQWTQNLSDQAKAAYDKTRQVAAEQCGEGAALQDAPPKPSLPSGEYPQDILNSQPMGLPGGPAPLACPISCAGITQAWCSSFCSAPVGPCAQCAFCAAQGCP